MRLKFHDIEIEIEGAEAFVKKEFETQKSFVLSQIASKPAPQSTNAAVTQQETPTGEDTDNISDLPSLNVFAANDVASTESDWIMAYAMYATKGTDRDFSLKDLRDLYRATGRAVVKRMNNVRNNMKTLLNKGLFVESAPGVFSLSRAGIKYGRELLAGKTPSKFAKDIKKTRKRGRKPGTAVNIERQRRTTVDLTDDDKSSYTSFVRSKKPVKAAERIAVATKWYTDNKGKESIGMDELRTLLTTNGKLPGAFGAVISQMKGKTDSLVTSPSRGQLSLSETGKSFVEALPRKSSRKTAVKSAKKTKTGAKNNRKTDADVKSMA